MKRDYLLSIHGRSDGPDIPVKKQKEAVGIAAFGKDRRSRLEPLRMRRIEDFADLVVGQFRKRRQWRKKRFVECVHLGRAPLQVLIAPTIADAS